jgi:glycine betaine catabolism B
MTFSFSTEGTGFRYLSQQAVRVGLPGVDDPWGAVRSFSMSSSPSEPGRISVTCKISDTPFKQALARLRPGDTAEVVGPLGAFLLERDRPSVFLAGGIGVTPFRGMMRFASDSGDSAERLLFYSARVPDEFVFRPEFDELGREHSQFRALYTVTRPTESTRPWTGRVGRIAPEWVREESAALVRPMYYVAGLPEMVQESVRMLQDRLGVKEEDIDYEVFRGY